MKPKILIFDKDQAITQQMFWTLCDDYDVVTANDLETAVRRAAVYQPTLSIVDLSSLPNQGSRSTGLRVLKYLKAYVPKSRILGITSDRVSDAKNESHTLGIDAFLEKPFETEQLLRFLRRLAPSRSLDLVESGSFRLCY